MDGTCLMVLCGGVNYATSFGDPEPSEVRVVAERREKTVGLRGVGYKVQALHVSRAVLLWTYKEKNDIVVTGQ